jgi:hypothetical protein
MSLAPRMAVIAQGIVEKSSSQCRRMRALPGAKTTRGAHRTAHGAALESQRPQGCILSRWERRRSCSPRAASRTKETAPDRQCTATQTTREQPRSRWVGRATERTLNEVRSQQPAHHEKDLVEISNSSAWWPQSSKGKAPDRPATMGGEGTQSRMVWQGG